MKMYATLNSSSCRYSFAVAVTFAALLMSGCSDKNKPATQIVAKVNNDEISIHQVNNAVAQLPHAPTENIDKVRRDVLTNLVSQQLVMQQAISQKLDRSPEIMMQIEASRREILTRAYLSRLVAGLPKPSADEDKKFYDEHPELFAQRRIYSLQEISLQNPRLTPAELQKVIDGKSMANIAAELKQQNVAFTSSTGTRSAEQIPLPMLAKLAKLEDGQTSIMGTPQMVEIVHVEASQLLPINEEVALQNIPQYLMNEQAKLAINDTLTRLKSKSKIEYMNEFASTTHLADPNAVNVPMIQPVSEIKRVPNNIEKGIAGIR